MADSRVIVNARLPQRSGLYQIRVEAGRISAIAPQAPLAQKLHPTTDSTDTEIDVQGDWISLGAVDLQINGALGLAFPDLRVEQLDRLQDICNLLWQQGISGFCPTLVTTSLENFHSSLKAIQTFQQHQQRLSSSLSSQKLPIQSATIQSATVLGAHLEGPFLNPAKKGAHPAKYLQPLTLETLKRVAGEFTKAIRIVTLAPELASEPGIISWLTEQNITVSLGHSLATETQASSAFSAGAHMVTHAFNAMPGLHHREPGLLGAALANPNVFCGFIADGEHISKTMLDLLLRIDRANGCLEINDSNQQTQSQQNQPRQVQRQQTHNLDPFKQRQGLDRLFLVSDALSPLGLPDGVYPWDSRQINVANGTARLLDGTLSGTTLPLIAGAQNLVRWGLCSVEEAIALVTTNPRCAIRQPGIERHQPAQFLRWSYQNDRLHWQWLWP
ncbi:N-acetylglucosamine-6-phosphate deacetylase [cf. Phormidesmis sp. LEGE 11477]|uniref:N-acetylglucosamine-6-phosphate deacetylase n=1 Tax=cf. Phormidesmis sp. LEGE 11477 TaxID=1828680 RepID=UPI00187F9C0C|nr:N-acetylglucosamine-6-phosphate deacetylase [cf. Phormidesmis sp. LEGE 11477]MBE9059575.1 N-acetylglucosamine-6-phosphate deacetylase [cf. Phormidesmis sp. LEGE 11477]